MSIEQKHNIADDVALSAALAVARIKQGELRQIVANSNGKLTKLPGMNVNLSNLHDAGEVHSVMTVIEHSIATAEAETECDGDDGVIGTIISGVQWLGSKLCGHKNHDKHSKEMFHKALAELGIIEKPKHELHLDKKQLAKELKILGYNLEQVTEVQHGLELFIAEQKLLMKQADKNQRELV